MKFKVKVTAGSKRRKVIQLDDKTLHVKLVSRAIRGEANDELINCLADHFMVKPSFVHIVRGFRSPVKTVEIL